MTRRFEAVLWDIDGTLVDSEPTHERSIDDVLKTIGAALSPQARARILGTSTAETHAILRGFYPAMPDLPAFLAAKTEAYLARASEIGFRQGVAEALAWAEAEGLRIGFVSNSDRVIVDANLRAVGLGSPQLASVARDDVRRGKPHPDPYRLAAEKLGLAPAACIVIEDSPIGAASGLAAYMTVIGWPPAPEMASAFPAEVVLADAVDLVGALAGLTRRDSRHPPAARRR